MSQVESATTFLRREEEKSQCEMTPVNHAVIIAAGRGSRFGNATCSVPKPLIKVAGVPIIQRTIMTASKAGIDKFTVVTGYQADCLEEHLEKQSLPDVQFRFVHNPMWRLPNGLSVLEASGLQPEPFILLMADHLFEEAILKKLLSSPLPNGHCRLAVDFHPENVVDLEDATKVRVVDGYIRDIGKKIKQYNAIDTGIFLCSNAIFDALEESVAEGRQSLSEGVLALARRECMEAVDIGHLFWQDVDNEHDLKECERRLLGLSVNDTC